MFKIVLSILFVVSLASGASVKANGCDLSVVGEVMLSLGSNDAKVVNYKAIAPSGKNFHSILVGSTMSLDGVTIEIIDIKSNKRVKRKARTGMISVVMIKDGKSQNLDMPYSYDKGVFSAEVKQKNGEVVGFVLEIKALLCYA